MRHTKTRKLVLTSTRYAAEELRRLRSEGWHVRAVLEGRNVRLTAWR